jgi:putative DNA primase/helicase
VILHFPEQIAPEERDPQQNKIARELAVIVRQLMQKFSDPMTPAHCSSHSRTPTRRSASSAMPTRHLIFAAIWKPCRSLRDVYWQCHIIPRQPRLYLYHAYLAYMEAHGYRNT